MDQAAEVEGVDAVLSRLLTQLESGGWILALLQNDGGDLCLAFELGPERHATQLGTDAARELTERFEADKDFREALISFTWNVGSVYVTGDLRSQKTN